MSERLDSFFNWQSDMDWAWGPFLPLRPPPEAPMLPGVWVRLFVVFTLLGSVLVMLLEGLCVLGPRLAARQHWAVPPPLSETLVTLTAMGADPSVRRLLISLGFCLPFFFFAACLPFHAAWNRRAARLSQAPPPDASTAETPPDVWPPAPNNSS